MKFENFPRSLLKVTYIILKYFLIRKLLRLTKAFSSLKNSLLMEENLIFKFRNSKIVGLWQGKGTDEDVYY